MISSSHRDFIFMILAGIFITNALIGELIGGKLIEVGPWMLTEGEDPWKIGPFAMSVGVFSWPIVFLTTDLINEYFGREGVRKLTLLTVGLIIYTFVVVGLTRLVPAASFSPVSSEQFDAVFGQSQWIIVGSIVAFAASQFIDVAVFWIFRKKTSGKKLWLRATGSTAVSQLVDSFVIISIAFWLPGKIKTEEFLNVAFSNYSYKFLIAIALTPLIYASHGLIDRYLGKESEKLISEAAKQG